MARRADQASWVTITLFAAALMTAGCAGAKTKTSAPGADVDQTMIDAAAVTGGGAVNAAGKFIAFDFGLGDTMPPFKANAGGEDIIFAGNVQFGTATPNAVPDPVISDYATADYMTVTSLDKGPYRAAIIAQNTIVGLIPGRDFSIAANGNTVADEKVAPTRFFSSDGLFYGMQFDDLPGTDWWGRYVQPVAPWRTFAVESDGGVRFDFKDCKVFALVMAKASDVTQQEFDAFIAGIDKARRELFYANSFRFVESTPAAGAAMPASDIERARGFVTFSRYWGEDVDYADVPSTDERITDLSVAGTQFERVIVPLSIRTLRDLDGVSVAVSDLAGGRGGKIPASAVSVEAVRYKVHPTWMRHSKGEKQVQAFASRPAVLQEQSPLDLPADTSKSWWLIVSIPHVSAGTYRGTVKVTSNGCPAAELPLSVEVYPFRLAPVAASIGLWYTDPAELGYNTDLIGGTSTLWRAPYKEPYLSREQSERDSEIEAFRVAMLEADLKSIAEHGFNGVTTNLPRVVSVSRQGEVTLDFSSLDAYMTLLPKYQINTAFAGQSHLLGIGRQIAAMMVDGRPVAEYSELHQKAYKNALKQIAAYFDKAGVRMLAYVVDEPREQEINPWNRNMEGTLYYVRLANEVGLWPSTVTTMADRDNGISYMPIMEAEAVVQPHPGSRDVESVAYARKTGKPLRYFNGSGFHRYPYGFYIWSQKPEGYWQWHFDFWTIAWNPVWEENTGFTIYPSPDGPLATPGYERAAQGIYDYRYALTLEEVIKEAKASGKPAAAKAADEAQSFLDDVRKNCTEWVLDDEWRPVGVPDEKLIEWRAGVVKHILAIQAAQ